MSVVDPSLMARVLMLLCACAACGAAEAQDPIEVTPVCGTLDQGVWSSAPWPPQSTDRGADGALLCPWIRYDGRATLRIHHDLARTPRSIELYVAFTEDGAASAPSAGDITRIISAGDEVISVRNGTNQDFFLNVVLH